MKTITLTQPTQDLGSLIKETIANSAPVQILTGMGEFVLLSKEEWESLQETMYLLSIPGFLESIKEAGADEDGWVCESEVDWGV